MNRRPSPDGARRCSSARTRLITALASFRGWAGEVVA
ncbi:hypothetical protein BJ981_004432 [Sphaerisporangium krabiense]|uniref:Uncharacterized protein n=1 Tax=Sphaerisporangium krabiense TaxID=763782 RepID=A0A7W9DRR1_9ACTN|nr:hypothetical protein [Sphaerisporangium krabiense]